MTEREEQAVVVLNTLHDNPLLSDIHRQALEVGIMAIKALSSSEKPNKWMTEARRWKRRYLDLKHRYLVLEQQTRWISVSERLPEKTGIYLISIGDLVTSKSFDGHNFRTESAVRFIPDAWMPLPEPYKAESEAQE